MKLTEIAILFHADNGKTPKISDSRLSVQEYFYRNLKSGKNCSVRKIILFLHEGNAKNFNNGEVVKNIYDIHVDFDFSVENESVHQIRKSLADIITKQLITESNNLNILSDELNIIFENYVKNGCINEWIFKNRTFWNESRTAVASITCYWDEIVFRATANILDKKGMLIKKDLLVEVPFFKGDFIYYCRAYWHENKFILQSKNNKYEVEVSTPAPAREIN